MAATRTSKNSSRLLAEMERNFTRSRRGLPSSSASSSTRRLNAIQEVSRLRKYSGLSSETRAMPAALCLIRGICCLSIEVRLVNPRRSLGEHQYKASDGRTQNRRLKADTAWLASRKNQNHHPDRLRSVQVVQSFF